MRLLAISDLHLSRAANREALAEISSAPEDWLVVAGDVGHRFDHLRLALDILVPRFARVIWTPGNHDLWSHDDEPRGLERYQALVEICRGYGVSTPEDPFLVWPGVGPPTVIAPLFLLYDYSFRPDDVPLSEAVDWARASGVLCRDERFLLPDPYPSREAWCAARCEVSERRLESIPQDHATVLVSHFPLLHRLAIAPRIPRFSIWCGTTRTAAWHRRFRARVAISGHLHLRSTVMIDGTRFEEVSLGYPRQWRPEAGVDAYLQTILG